MSGYVDLSLEIRHGDPTFPWDPKCSVLSHNTIETIGYNITQISMSTHQATHLDVPFHFIDEGKTVEDIPLDQVCGRALMVDLSHKRSGEPIRIDDFTAVADHIGKGSKVVWRTGWDGVFPERRYFSDMPPLSLELAGWFAEREVGLLGMDVPTPNPADYIEVHELLLGAGAVLVEGMAHLERVTSPWFWLCAAPLLLMGRDGSPVRAFGSNEA